MIRFPHVHLDSWFEPLSRLKQADSAFYKSSTIDIFVSVNIISQTLKGEILLSGKKKIFCRSFRPRLNHHKKYIPHLRNCCNSSEKYSIRERLANTKVQLLP